MGRDHLASGWSLESEGWVRTDFQRFGSRDNSKDSSFSARAFVEGLLAANPSFSEKLDGRFLKELHSLTRERDAEMFFEGLLALGERLEGAGKIEPALALYSALVDLGAKAPPYGFPVARGFSPAPAEGGKTPANIPYPQIKKAQHRLDALQGRGHFGRRAEVLIGDFSDAATDYRVITPMIAGSMVYQIAKTATLTRLATTARATWMTRGLGARATSSLAGFLFEIPTFSLASRGLMTLSGEEVSWKGDAISRDLLGATLTLGTLKLSGWAGQKVGAGLAPARVQRPSLSAGPLQVTGALAGGQPGGSSLQSIAHSFVSQASMFLGLLGAHRLEEAAGLRPHVDGATTIADTFGTMISLGVGSHLAQGLLGRRWKAFQNEMNLRARSRDANRPQIPTWLQNLFPKQPLLSASQVGVDSPVRLSPSEPLGQKASDLQMMAEMRMEQRLEFKLTMGFIDPLARWAEIYEAAEKRRYQKHGLDFEYAVVRRQDFPYMLSTGTGALYVWRPNPWWGDAMCGAIFVMEDFFVHPEISPELQQKLVEIFAVHEHGESIFMDHHQASLLEFAVAQKEGILEEYLKFLEKKYFLKFRDISLYRMGKHFAQSLKKYGVETALQDFDIDPSPPDPDQDWTAPARELRDGFRWPKGLEERYADALNEDEELAREKVEDWVEHIVVNEQARGYLSKAVEAAIEAGKSRIREGQTLPGAIQAIGKVLIQTLFPFHRELTKHVFNPDLLEGDVLVNLGRSTRDQIIQGLIPALQERYEDPVELAEAKKLLIFSPILQRDLKTHLKRIGLENQWIKKLGVREKLNSELYSLIRERLGRMVNASILSGRAKDDLEALALPDGPDDFKWVDWTVEKILEGMERGSSLEEYLFVLEKTVIANLVLLMENWHLDWKMDTPVLEFIADAIFLKFSPRWKEVFQDEATSLPHPSIDLPSLRQKFGEDLKDYPPVLKYANENFRDWFQDQFLIESFENAGPAERAGIVQKLTQKWCASIKNLFNYFSKHRVPDELAFSLIDHLGFSPEALAKDGPALLDYISYWESPDIPYAYNYPFFGEARFHRDQARREILASWLTMRGQSDLAPFARSFQSTTEELRRLAEGAQIELAGVMENYLHLLGEYLADRYFPYSRESIRNGPALQVFLQFSDPKIRREALFLLGEYLYPEAVEELISLAKTDEEVRKYLASMGRSAKKSEALPLVLQLAALGNPHVLNLLREKLAHGDMPTLVALASHPDLQNPASPIRQLLLPKVSIRSYLDQPEAFPSLKILAKHGAARAKGWVAAKGSAKPILALARPLNKAKSESWEEVQNKLAQLVRLVSPRKLNNLVLYLEELIQKNDARTRANLRLCVLLLAHLERSDRLARIQAWLPLLSKGDKLAEAGREALDELINILPPEEAARVHVLLLMKGASSDPFWSWKNDVLGSKALGALEVIMPKIPASERQKIFEEVLDWEDWDPWLEKRGRIFGLLDGADRLRIAQEIEDSMKASADEHQKFRLGRKLTFTVAHLDPQDRLAPVLAILTEMPHLLERTFLGYFLLPAIRHLTPQDKVAVLEQIFNYWESREQGNPSAEPFSYQIFKEYFKRVNELNLDLPEIFPHWATQRGVKVLLGKFYQEGKTTDAGRILAEIFPKLDPVLRKKVLAELKESLFHADRVSVSRKTLTLILPNLEGPEREKFQKLIDEAGVYLRRFSKLEEE